MPIQVKLYRANCFDILPTLENKSIDAIITDLPYGTTACEWDTVIDLNVMWKQVKRILNPTGSFITTATQPYATHIISSNAKWFKYEWIWRKSKKNGFQHSKNMPMREHENILVFSPAPMGHESTLGDKRMVYNPQGVMDSGTKKVRSASHGETMGGRTLQEGISYTSQTGFPGSILSFRSIWGDNNFHPTQKPISLYEYLIKTYTHDGATVLDFTMGSGTTGVAAVIANRSFIGIEKEQKYFDSALHRLEKLKDRISNLQVYES